jgi:hypothetical protein
MTPGTSFAGTLPNGLTPCVPGMAWPGVLELGVAPDCAKDSVVPYRKTPASKSMQLGPKLSFTGASTASHLVHRLCQGKTCYSCRRFRATRICAAHFGCLGSKRKLSPTSTPTFFYNRCSVLTARHWYSLELFATTYLDPNRTQVDFTCPIRLYQHFAQTPPCLLLPQSSRFFRQAIFQDPIK